MPFRRARRHVTGGYSTPIGMSKSVSDVIRLRDYLTVVVGVSDPHCVTAALTAGVACGERSGTLCPSSVQLT